ncbi:tyrosine-type recombinase/integrase [Nesterenkonia lacusekhoensis]|uniref:tyrosine-type recombinase/integrase n=1 Tax=Nesterenkonia lacusekhoensis TaxID=150832 RepID=UPI00337B2D9F
MDLTHRKLAHRGSRLGTVYVSESSVLFRPALGKADIANSKDYRIHDLRHAFASVNAKNGIAPKELQKVLGHKTLAITTDTYMHPCQEDFGG